MGACCTKRSVLGDRSKMTARADGVSKVPSKSAKSGSAKSALGKMDSGSRGLGSGSGGVGSGMGGVGSGSGAEDSRSGGEGSGSKNRQEWDQKASKEALVTAEELSGYLKLMERRCVDRRCGDEKKGDRRNVEPARIPRPNSCLNPKQSSNYPDSYKASKTPTEPQLLRKALSHTESSYSQPKATSAKVGDPPDSKSGPEEPVFSHVSLDSSAPPSTAVQKPSTEQRNKDEIVVLQTPEPHDKSETSMTMFE